MTARPHRSRPSGRALAVMLLLLLAAVALFPLDRDHHGTVIGHSHHLTAATGVTPHHHTGEPVPAHGHRHDSDVVSNLTPRARLTVTDAIVTITAVCGAATEPSARSGSTPAAPPDVDLTLLGVLRV